MNTLRVGILLIFAILSTSAEKGRQSDCPYLPDVLELGGNPWDTSMNPLFEFHGNSSFQSARIIGLSGIDFQGSLDVLYLELPFTYDSPRVIMTAEDYSLSGYFDFRPLTFLPLGNFSGTGTASAMFSGLRMAGTATIGVNLISNKANIRVLSLDELEFESACFNFGPDFVIGGSTVDWGDLCDNFKQNFDLEWNVAATRQGLTEKVRLALNTVLLNFTLTDLIDFLCCWKVVC